MLECPLPQPLDDVMFARLMLLQQRGLAPQLFLPDVAGLPDVATGWWWWWRFVGRERVLVTLMIFS